MLHWSVSYSLMTLRVWMRTRKWVGVGVMVVERAARKTNCLVSIFPHHLLLMRPTLPALVPIDLPQTP